MDSKKLKASLLAITVATAVALSGTFAWQSIRQTAANVMEQPSNPGGRLHDDFNGYGADKTKDVYVENFGNQSIYARVRLDEYMEIGDGAGLKKNDAGYSVKTAQPLVAGQDINDPATWTTHKPDSTLTPGTPQTPADAADDPFHTYWTWTLGGQAADNPEGKTVYMPTFNKNQDSLKADINGTFGGLDPTDSVHYDDFVKYATDSASGTTAKTAAEFLDGDGDTPTGDTVEHTAQETLPGKVLTMTEWKALDDADPGDGTEWKGSVQAWVYDADGWAYWSQPIAPNTATGLLLDRVELTAAPEEAWYYVINVVAECITASDLGRTDSTGFYSSGAPTGDALDLLDFIGVNTASVDGSIAITATAGDPAQEVGYTAPGMVLTLDKLVSVAGQASTGQDVTWELSGNASTSTKLTGTTLTVAADETAGALTVTARSSVYPGLKGRLTLPVRPTTYAVEVTADGGAASIIPGQSQTFTAKLTSNNLQTLTTGFNWALDTSARSSYADGTSVSGSGATGTLTTGTGEVGTVYLKVTPTDSAYSAATPGTISIAVTSVSYTVDIQPSNVVVTETTAEIRQNHSADFGLVITSDPGGISPVGTWTWNSSDDTVATVKAKTDTTAATVTVPSTAAVDATCTITATNDSYSPSLTANFTVKVKEQYMTVNGIEWCVLVQKASITGTDGNTHNAALLLSKDLLEEREFDASSNKWSASALRAYLNSSESGGWLNGKETIQNKAVEVTLYTRGTSTDSTEENRQVTQDKIFLLSEADVSGKSNFGNSTPQTWEYTYNGAKIPYFVDNNSRIATLNGTAYAWWLRSPGADSGSSVDVSRVYSTGAILANGFSKNASGVRPAFWYNLDA